MNDPAQYAPERVYAALIEAGDEWAAARHGFQLLSETKKTVLAELKTQSAKKSDAARETEALASGRFREHVTAMVDAEQQMNKSRVRYDALWALHEARRTEVATRRREMQFVQEGGAS